MRLHLDVTKCVRATSKLSQCTRCVEATDGLVQIEEQLPVFAKGTGVEAAACVGVCPTEAFSLSDFSVTEFFFTFLDSKIRLISRKVNVPCLSVLSVEHLISLALASETPVTLDLNDYEEGTVLFNEIAGRIEEANFILSSFSDKQLEINVESDRHSGLDLESTETDGDTLNRVRDDNRETAADRRAFLRNTTSLKGVVKHKKEFEEAVEADELHHFEIDPSMTQKIRDKHLPDKRKILFTTLKHAQKPEQYEVVAEEDVSFVSQKFVNEDCTNCQICYRICPTGALSSNKKFSLIHFDAMLCVKCRLCHDVCEPDAIQLQPGFEVKEFFEPTQRTLATFSIKRCNECGNPFTYLGGEQTCPRCLIEEEEAIFLHENALKMEKSNET
ncbi:MAG: 4Fe-4S binding protein [Sulfurovum sp.]|nr:4Fe-4S binding protein [Sulfurovum sp.]